MEDRLAVDKDIMVAVREYHAAKVSWLKYDNESKLLQKHMPIIMKMEDGKVSTFEVACRFVKELNCVFVLRRKKSEHSSGFVTSLRTGSNKQHICV